MEPTTTKNKDERIGEARNPLEKQGGVEGEDNLEVSCHLGELNIDSDMETDETIDCVGAETENELLEDPMEVSVIATSSIKPNSRKHIYKPTKTKAKMKAKDLKRN